MQFTIDEYSKHYKMSKEMIASKLKSKKLDYKIEDGVTYIMAKSISIDPVLQKEVPTIEKEVLKEELPKQEEISKKDFVQEKTIKQEPSKHKTTVATVIALYQSQNTSLKEKIMQLEIKIDKLIGDKEQMLRDERDKIEQLYSKKDEQLKNILELVNTKMLMQHNQTQTQTQTIHDVQPVEPSKTDIRMVELKEHLKTLNLKSFQRKVIKRRFISVYDTDDRIVHKDGRLYLDFTQYDYSDLLSY